MPLCVNLLCSRASPSLLLLLTVRCARVVILTDSCSSTHGLGLLADAPHDALTALQAPLRVHPLRFAGKSVKEKLQDIRKQLKGPYVGSVHSRAPVLWLHHMQPGSKAGGADFLFRTTSCTQQT